MPDDPILYSNLRRLINVIDELRDVGLHHYINLPRICVVGTQSAGKSSVLEAIVGIDFLPRGEGVVTRRPLELRLVHEANESVQSYAIFDAHRDKKYTNFEEVRRVIDELTEEVAGKNKGIVDNPIVLTVHSHRCPDLTLIDLPGITRVPLKGSDQTDDIEKLTRDMATRYAKDPRTIVLAVVAANADMTTSDALQLARRVDPKGIRTIGVVTKIDLMDRGTDALKMLNGDEVPLRLGFTGVRNRSQQDIKDRKTIEDAIKAEKEFFSSHPLYRSLPPHMVGTQSLTEKLTRVLFRHIKTYLPEIKREICTRIRTLQNRLDELGNGVPVDQSDRVQLMWSMITDYCEIYRNTIRGKFDKRLQTYFENHDISSGSKIRAIFNDLLSEYMETDVTSEMSDYDIDVAIRMHEGDSLPGFPSPDTFEYLILPHLSKIHSPVIDCLDRVTQSLELLSQKIASRVFGRFPSLSEQVLEQSSVIIAREKENTRQILENIVMAETGYLFTNDSNYLSQHGSVITTTDNTDKQGRQIQQMPTVTEQPQMNAQQNGPNTNALATNAQALYSSIQSSVPVGWMQDKKKTHYGATFIHEIRSRLDAYFRIILKNIRDSAPKIIGYFLVRQLQEKLQFELYNDLNKADRMSELLGEPPQIMEERQGLLQQLLTLKNASQVLQRDPSITALTISEFDELYDSDVAQLHQQTTGQRQIDQNGIKQPNSNPAGQPQQQQQQQQQQAQQQQAQQPQPPPTQPTASNLWGLRATSAPKQDPQKRTGSLFGDRQTRGDANVFNDPKMSNPLYG